MMLEMSALVMAIFKIMEHRVMAPHVLESMPVELLHSPAVGFGVQVVMSVMLAVSADSDYGKSAYDYLSDGVHV